MKVKVLIVDDNNNDLDIIKNDLEKYDFDIECVNDVTNIKKQYDIVLMDIELKQDKNGIDYVKEKFSNSIVIYITGYSEYCTKVYETNHIYFLLKPYDKKDFDKAIKKAIQNKEEKNKSIMRIKSGSSNIIIHIDEITYLESNKRKIIINTEKDVYEIYNTLKNIKEVLPKKFVFCHNSFIVNLSKVRTINKNSFVLENNKEIPISQKKYKEVKEYFLSFIGGLNE